MTTRIPSDFRNPIALAGPVPKAGLSLGGPQGHLAALLSTAGAMEAVALGTLWRLPHMGIGGGAAGPPGPGGGQRARTFRDQWWHAGSDPGTSGFGG